MKPVIGPDPGREPPQRVPAAELVEQWLSYEALQHRAYNTLRRFRGAGQALVEAAGDLDLTKLTPAQYQSFVDQYGKRCANFADARRGAAPSGTLAVRHPTTWQYRAEWTAPR